MKDTKKISKGDLVRFATFAEQKNWRSAWRPLTDKETADWYAKTGASNPNNRGMGDDGETRLSPQSERYTPAPDVNTFIVLRARCAPARGYYKSKGQVQCLDVSTGVEFYIAREDVVLL